MDQSEIQSKDPYLIDRKKVYKAVQPSPLDNLLAIYGLEDTARGLARTKEDGSKGVKLRKSYKNHIQDLPGRHNVTSPKPIPNGLLDPMLGQFPNIIKAFEPETLSKGLEFDKTPVNGIPGFDTVELGMSDQQTLMRRDDGSDHDEEKRKRKKKQLNGDTPKRQHI